MGWILKRGGGAAVGEEEEEEEEEGEGGEGSLSKEEEEDEVEDSGETAANFDMSDGGGDLLRATVALASRDDDSAAA